MLRHLVCVFLLFSLIPSNVLSAISVCDLSSGSLNVPTGTTCRLNAGSYSLSSVSVSGTLICGGNTTVGEGSGVHIFAVSFVVSSSGVVSADGQGFTQNSGPGRGQDIGCCDNYGGGAGHAGQGILQWTNTVNRQGKPYGNFFFPTSLGSGGGSAWGATGGAGGGAIHIKATTIVIEGLVTSNGLNSTDQSTLAGGGSGGSIWIEAGDLSGSGSMSANGGFFSSGGRIAIYATERMTFQYSKIVSQPSEKTRWSFPSASVGTIFLNISGLTKVYADGNRFTGPGYILSSGSAQSYSFDSIELVRNGSIAFSGPLDTTSISSSQLSGDKTGLIYITQGVIEATSINKFDVIGIAVEVNGTALLSSFVVFNSTRCILRGKISGVDHIVFEGTEVLVNATGNTVGYPESEYHFSTVSITSSSILRMGGDFLLSRGATLSAVNVSISKDSSINANGLGFSRNTGPGAGQSIGCCSSPSGGAGHAGNGSFNENSAYGRAYGYFRTPETMGSGGGNTWDNSGANGGGAFHLIATGKLQLDGTLSANGDNPRIAGYQSAGGSGGSIWVECGELSGNGYISADGGYYSSGGRIAIYYTTMNIEERQISAKTSSYSGTNIRDVRAASGSIYLQSSSGYKTIIADGMNKWAPAYLFSKTPTVHEIDRFYLTRNGSVMFSENDTLILSPGQMNGDSTGIIFTDGLLNATSVFDYSFIGLGVSLSATALLAPSVSVSNTSFFVYGQISGADDLTLSSNARFQFNASGNSVGQIRSVFSFNSVSVLGTSQIIAGGDFFLNKGPTISASIITIASSAVVHANGMGFSRSSGPGRGRSIGCCDSPAGGAGHAGNGSVNPSGSEFGWAYGNFRKPETLGSGGGNTWDSSGANGGGAIHLVATRSLVLEGKIQANGDNPCRSCGYQSSGGSGGSIWIEANDFSGNGNISTTGGYYSSGGWVAIYYNTSTFDYKNVDCSGNRVFSREVLSGSGSVFLERGSDGYTTLYSNGGGSWSPAYLFSNSSTTYKIDKFEFVNNGSVVFASENDTLLLSPNQFFGDGTGLIGSMGTVDASSISIFEGIGLHIYPNTTALFSPSVTLRNVSFKIEGLISGMNNLIVDSKSVLQFNASGSSVGENSGVFKLETIEVKGKSEIRAGGNFIFNYGPTIIALNSIIVANDSSIHANGMGYSSSTGPGAAVSFGCCDSPAGGAGHAGMGGGNTRVGWGKFYGDFAQPTTMGSGGGNTYDGRGANGGGALRLITSTLVIEGRITANGDNPCTSCGYQRSGGSGGSIWLECDDLSGSGYIQSLGGFYSSGGFIAVYHKTGGFDQSHTSATGNRQFTLPAASGTVLFKQGDRNPDLFSNGAGFTIPAHLNSTINITEFNSINFVNYGAAVFYGTYLNLRHEQLQGDSTGYIQVVNYLNASTITEYSKLGVRTLPSSTMLLASSVTLTTNYTMVIEGTISGVENIVLTGDSILQLNASGKSEGQAISVYKFTSVELVQSNILVGGDFTNNIGPTINADTINIGVNSSISANGMGFSSGTGPGRALNVGCCDSRGGGAGHAGIGTENRNDATYGQPYGDFLAPVTMGSGGGNTYDGRGANGGGAVHIISKSLTIHGLIQADGDNPCQNCGYQRGGGSGGSIWIESDTIQGNGYITSLGGYFSSGGWIAIYCNTSTFDYKHTSAKGSYSFVSSPNPGSGAVYLQQGDYKILYSDAGGLQRPAHLSSPGKSIYKFDKMEFVNGGSVLFKATDTIIIEQGQLEGDGTGLIYSNGIVNASTVAAYNKIGLFLNPSSYAHLASNITISNISFFICGPVANVSNISIESGSLVQFNASGYSVGQNKSVYLLSSVIVKDNSQLRMGGDFVLNKGPTIIADNLFVDVNASVNADGLGFSASTGPGAGQWKGCCDSPGGGAGHAGFGAHNTNTNVGKPYGDFRNPTALGSSGGGTVWYTGANGGGAIKMIVENAVINGRISADGDHPALTSSYQATGGSGGSVLLHVGNLEGTGFLSANGGYFSSGGRIAVYYYTSTFNDANIVANPNQYWADTVAGAGTIYLEQYGVYTKLKATGGGKWSPAYLDTVPTAYHFDSIDMVLNGSVVFRNTDSLVINADDEITGDGTGLINIYGNFTTNKDLYDKMGVYVQNGASAVVPNNFTMHNVSWFVDGVLTGAKNLTVLKGGVIRFGAKGQSAGSAVSYFNFTSINIVHGQLQCAGDITKGLGVTINASEVLVHSLGGFNADGWGFPQNQGPGAGRSYGCCDGNGGAAGHGGVATGLYNNNDATKGQAYGSFTAPITLGSGGGGTVWYSGANGGGAIHLICDRLFLDGTMSADGGKAQRTSSYPAADGSGGSIWVETKHLSGDGKFTADSYRSSSGGRIAVYYDDGYFTFHKSSAFGGAAMGTVYVVEKGTKVKVVLSGTSALPSFSVPFPFPVEELYLTYNAAYTIPTGTTWNISSVIGGDGKLVNNGTLRVGSLYASATIENKGRFIFTGSKFALGPNAYINWPQTPASGRLDLVLDSFVIEKGAIFDVSGTGHALGAGPSSSPNCTGGGNGGIGGGESASSVTVDDAYNPVAFGSASGLCSNRVNGTGGGSLHIVTRTFNVSGTVQANGISGGAGGSIWVQCLNCISNGTLSASGSHNTRASGGGGRISLMQTNQGKLILTVAAGRSGFGVVAQPGVVTTIPAPAVMFKNYLLLKVSAFKDLTPYALEFAPIDEIYNGQVVTTSPLPVFFYYYPTAGNGPDATTLYGTMPNNAVFNITAVFDGTSFGVTFSVSKWPVVNENSFLRFRMRPYTFNDNIAPLTTETQSRKRTEGDFSETWSSNQTQVSLGLSGEVIVDGEPIPISSPTMQGSFIVIELPATNETVTYSIPSVQINDTSPEPSDSTTSTSTTSSSTTSSTTSSATTSKSTSTTTSKATTSTTGSAATTGGTVPGSTTTSTTGGSGTTTTTTSSTSGSSTTGGTGPVDNRLMYFDGSSEASNSGCGCADGKFYKPVDYKFNVTLMPFEKLIVVYANVPLNFSTTLCRIAGAILQTDAYINGTISCPLLLGNSPTSFEISVDGGDSFYMLETIPALTTSDDTVVGNQLEDNTFLFAWTGLTGCSIVDVTLIVTYSDNPSRVASKVELSGLQNNGSISVTLSSNAIVIAVIVTPQTPTCGVVTGIIDRSCNWYFCGSQSICVGQTGTHTPANLIDALCKIHDECVATRDKTTCDNEFVEDLKDTENGCHGTRCRDLSVTYPPPKRNRYNLYYFVWLVRRYHNWIYIRSRSWGDPHFVTFSGCYYDFMGQGDFMHSQINDVVTNTTTKVMSRFRPAANIFAGATLQSAVAVVVETPHDTSTIQISANKLFATLLIDGANYFLPLNHQGTIVYTHGSIAVDTRRYSFAITLASGINVEVSLNWLNNRVSGVYINVPTDLAEQTAGLLGTPYSTDFRSPNGDLIQTCSNSTNYHSYIFGYTWQVNNAPMISSCPIDVCGPAPPAPSEPRPPTQVAVDRCAQFINNEPAYRACLYDVTALNDTKGAEATEEVHSNINLENVTIAINATGINNTITIVWTLDEQYENYLLQMNGGSYWNGISSRNNPTTQTVSNGVYNFRICVTEQSAQSPWMYSNSVTISYNPVVVEQPPPVIEVTTTTTSAIGTTSTTSSSTVTTTSSTTSSSTTGAASTSTTGSGSTTGGQSTTGGSQTTTGSTTGGNNDPIDDGKGPYTYHDASPQAAVTSCGCGDGLFLKPVNLVFNVTWFANVKIIVISSQVQLNASTSLCRIGGILLLSAQFNSESVSCPMLQGNAPMSVEFSIDNGETFYVLETLPALQAGSNTAIGNQIDHGDFVFVWPITPNASHVNVTVIVQHNGNSSGVSEQVVIPQRPNNGSITVSIPDDSIIVGIIIIPIGGEDVISVIIDNSCNWRYCGSSSLCVGQPTDYTLPPLNAIDALCKMHDECSLNGNKAECDEEMAELIREIPSGCVSSKCHSAINYGLPRWSWYNRRYFYYTILVYIPRYWYWSYTWGDPHFYTFDNCAFNFMGLGDYVLSEVEDSTYNVTTQVITRLRPLSANSAFTANAAVAVVITTPTETNVIQISGSGYYGTLTIDGKYFFLPLDYSQTIPFALGSIAVQHAGRFSVSLMNGVQVNVHTNYLTNRISNVYVGIPSYLNQHTKGLLGTPGSRNYVSPSGEVVQTCETQTSNKTYTFGYSWRVTESPIVSSCPVDVCPVYPVIELPPPTQAEQDACAGLTGAFLEACLFDVINLNNTSPNVTNPNQGASDTQNLQNVTISITGNVVNSTITISWVPDPSFPSGTYALQLGVGGMSNWNSLGTRNNPVSITVSDGVYVARISLEERGSQSPWAYTPQLIVNTTSSSVIVKDTPPPSPPVIITTGTTHIATATTGSTPATTGQASTGTSDSNSGTTSATTGGDSTGTSGETSDTTGSTTDVSTSTDAAGSTTTSSTADSTSAGADSTGAETTSTGADSTSTSTGAETTSTGAEISSTGVETTSTGVATSTTGSTEAATTNGGQTSSSITGTTTNSGAATSNGGQTSSTSSASTTGSETSIPPVPTNVVVTPGRIDIEIRWDASPVAGNTEYIVEVSNLTHPLNVSSSRNTLSVFGLTPNTTYSVRVLAKNSLGSSEFSLPEYATTKPLSVPAQVAIPVIGAYGRNYIEVTWRAPSDDGGLPIQSYNLSYSVDRVTWFDVSTSHLSWMHERLSVATTYYYSVSAVNSKGPGPVSPIASLSTASEMCGDNVCDASEDCKSCFLDCGACATVCPGTAQCNNKGECNNGMCNCVENWAGHDCSFSNALPITIVTNQSAPQIKIESSNPSSGEFARFGLTFESIQEINDDGPIVTYELNLQNFTLAGKDEVLNDGSIATNYFYETQLPNTAKVLIKITTYVNATTIFFANNAIEIGEYGMKYAMTVKTWPFLAIRNKIKINIRTEATVKEGECASVVSGDDGGDTLRWLNIHLNGISLYGKFEEYALLDDIARSVQFSYSHVTSLVSITVPHFWNSAEFDPNFQVLVDTTEGTKETENTHFEGECGEVAIVQPKSKSSSMTIIVGASVGGVAAIALASAGVLFFLSKKKQRKTKKRLTGIVKKSNSDPLVSPASASLASASPFDDVNKPLASSSASSLYKSTERSNPLYN